MKAEQSTPSPKTDGAGDTGVLAQFEQVRLILSIPCIPVLRLSKEIGVDACMND